MASTLESQIILEMREEIKENRNILAQLIEELKAAKVLKVEEKKEA